MIAAALLTEEPVTLRRVPRIRDVVVMQETLGDLGADVVPLEGTEVWRSLRCRARSPDVGPEPRALPLYPEADG